ncbi:peptide chain release factor N(5)-glutamine methyltransferase [uncultured Psychrobacter sp.]|uniref:peptide chain release factor N(5)-glutamine methyltransferase n=1 Tax=uncultured Psychrobacter sp. TaxID=259303 RepID=UPI003459AB8D
MTTLSIRQVKQQIAQLANTKSTNNLPTFWLTDWLLHVIDKPALFLITDDNYELTDSELEEFNAGVIKMQQGVPLAYLTGHQEFWSLDFCVNEHTLIPRPDTEVLVEQVLQWIRAQDSYNVNKSNSDRHLDKANIAAIEHTDTKCLDAKRLDSRRLLDLGTGSGCIAISLAYELKDNLQKQSLKYTGQERWQVVAVDISAEALKVAKHNAVANNVEVKFIQSSWYEALSTDASKLFDVIVSNPPYIDETDEHLTRLQAEPISALSASNHGLADIEFIVRNAPEYLQIGGLLALEHGYDQGLAVRELFLASGFEFVQTIKDYGGNDRITLGQKPLKN